MSSAHREDCYLESRQLDVKRRIEIPGIAGNDLVMPDIATGIGIECDDGTDEQIVAPARAADFPIPRRALAGPDVDPVELRIVSHRIPDCAAATMYRPVAAPGLCGRFHGRILESPGRVA